MEAMATPSRRRVLEVPSYKNHLQKYTQRASLQLPNYETINEGPVHAPRFRSTVIVNGVKYTSCNTFHRLREAEQDAAKLAFENILNTLNVEGVPPICEDTQFCKSILNEYANKRKIQLPAYTTQSKGILPLFMSSVVFDEKTYIGTPGKRKKEAEQLAARAAIQSILGDPFSGTSMLEIIQSKSKFYASLQMVDALNIEATRVPVSTLENAVNESSEARVESDSTLDKLPANQEIVLSASQNVAQATVAQLAELVPKEEQSLAFDANRGNTVMPNQSLGSLQVESFNSTIDKLPANQETILLASQNVAQATVAQLAEQVPKAKQYLNLDINRGNAVRPNQSFGSLQVESFGYQNVKMEANPAHLKMAGDDMQAVGSVGCSESGHVGTSGSKKRKHKKNKKRRRAKKPHI